MRGMLVKDFRLLLMQKQFFVVIVAVSVFMIASGQNTSFIVTYCTAMGMFFSVSSIAYDEFENGYAFLFTLPVSRRGYVVEKYLFGILCTGITWLLSVVCCGIYEQIVRPASDPAEQVLITAISGLVLFVPLAVMIPFRLKFGADRGRIVMMIVTALLFGLIFLVAKTADSFPVLKQAVRAVNGLSGPALSGVAFVFAVLAMGISAFVSIHIVEKKQF